MLRLHQKFEIAVAVSLHAVGTYQGIAERQTGGSAEIRGGAYRTSVDTLVWRRGTMRLPEGASRPSLS